MRALYAAVPPAEETVPQAGKRQATSEEHERLIDRINASTLYGWAMSQKFPAGKFAWVDPNVFSEDGN